MESPRQFLHTRRFQPNPCSFHLSIHQILDTLNIDIEDAHLVLIDHLTNTRIGRPIQVSMNNFVFEEHVLLNLLHHGVSCHKVIIHLK